MSDWRSNWKQPDADHLRAHMELHENVKRAQAQREAEQLRQERHHEVFVMVLKELVADALKLAQTRGCEAVPFEHHTEVARRYADAAYPPPKETE